MQANVNFDDVHLHQPIDTLVHLGAGRCSELDAYLRLQPKRLLLVEADPDLADVLLARTDNLPQVEVRLRCSCWPPRNCNFLSLQPT